MNKSKHIRECIASHPEWRNVAIADHLTKKLNTSVGNSLVSAIRQQGRRAKLVTPPDAHPPIALPVVYAVAEAIRVAGGIESVRRLLDAMEVAA